MPRCRLWESLGATTLRLPAVEIRPLKDRRTLTEQLGVLENFDVIVFTSANAVRFGVSFLDQKRGLTLAALGPATSRALNQAGYRVAIQPASFDSEGLLNSPRLERVAGHRILIITGTSGRDLLQQELTRRGAAVVCAQVYERVPATPSGAALRTLQDRFTAGGIEGGTATQSGARPPPAHPPPPPLRRGVARAPWPGPPR